MKLNSAEAKRFLRNPDRSCGAVLIYGPEPVRVEHSCRGAVDKLVGKNGREEMRADSVSADAVSGNAGALVTMLKGQSFFPGVRTVQMDRANDSVAGAVAEALDQRNPDDAFLLVTAGSLRPASKLRNLFESHRTARSAPVYADAADPEEINQLIARAAIRDIDPGAMRNLSALAQEISPLELGQLIEKIALYKLGSRSPVSSDDVQACAPTTSDVLVDRLLAHVADRKPALVSPAFRHVAGRGQNPVSICILATAMFRRIHKVASDPGGPDAGVSRLRPPVFGPRRRQLIEHARLWGVNGAENALREFLTTDRALRSGRKYPARAFVEHALVRVARMRTG